MAKAKKKTRSVFAEIAGIASFLYLGMDVLFFILDVIKTGSLYLSTEIIVSWLVWLFLGIFFCTRNKIGILVMTVVSLVYTGSGYIVGIVRFFTENTSLPYLFSNILSLALYAMLAVLAVFLVAKKQSLVKNLWWIIPLLLLGEMVIAPPSFLTTPIWQLNFGNPHTVGTYVGGILHILYFLFASLSFMKWTAKK